MYLFRKMYMKYFRCFVVTRHSFPPAPHHTFFGMVRDEFGRPLKGEKVEVFLKPPLAELLVLVGFTGDPGINYLTQSSNGLRFNV